MSRKHREQNETENQELETEEMEPETEEIPEHTVIEEWETDMPDDPEPELPKKNLFAKIADFFKNKLFEEYEEETDEEPEDDFSEEETEEFPEEEPETDFSEEETEEFPEEEPEMDFSEEETEEFPEEEPESVEESPLPVEVVEYTEELEESDIMEAPEVMPDLPPEIPQLEMLQTLTIETEPEPETESEQESLSEPDFPDFPEEIISDDFTEINDEIQDELPRLDYLDEETLDDIEADELPDLGYLEEEIPEIPEELREMEETVPDIPDDETEAPQTLPEVEEAAEKTPVLRILITLIITALFIFIIVLCFKNGVFDEKKIYYMPDLVGQNYNQVDDDSLNFDIQIDKSDFSGYEKDVIYEQDIPVGQEVKPGQTVHVNVSLGLAMTAVPDVRNYPYEYAQKTLEQAGFQTEIVYEDSLNGTQAMNVIRTEPAKGEEVVVGSLITIHVSQGLGADVAQVQSVVGKSLEEAIDLCESYGLDVETVGVPSLQPENIVIAQSMAAGSAAEFHTVITLTYSNGEQPEGLVEFQLNLPPYTNGRFILDFIDKEGTVIASSNMIVAGFSAGSLIPVEGYGSQEIKVVLTNYSTSQQAELGTYSFDFTTGVYTVLEEDTEQAFRAVGGIE